MQSGSTANTQTESILNAVKDAAQWKDRPFYVTTSLPEGDAGLNLKQNQKLAGDRLLSCDFSLLPGQNWGPQPSVERCQ